jgi:C-terminal processing protease CtpA/Prc
MDSLKGGSVSRHGTLGGEVLSRFTVVFNFPKEEVYLKRNDAFKKQFHYNLSGITVKAKGAKLNVYEITKVRQKSPGDKAGLLEGDEIISVNGIGAEYLDLNIVNAYLNRKPGKKIRLEIRREGQREKRVVVLADQI